jgi:hypothetical protein
VSQSTGCLFVHACPAALRHAVDDTAHELLQQSLVWHARPDGSSYADALWVAPLGTAASLTHRLRALGAVVFEVGADPGEGVDGERYSFVPGLGLFRAATNSIGDIVVDENQLGAALREAPNAEALREWLGRLLGRPWDDVLEPLRHRAAPVTAAAATG